MSSGFKTEAQELQRLAALRGLEILDTASEVEFDAAAKLAALICGTSAAAVSLVDVDRQWFKARVNVDLRQTPRSVAFCSHTIENDQAFVILDTHQDPRFDQNSLVTGPPYIRMYAGAPLTLSGGERVGALCVIDTVPRELNPAQIEGLKILAEMVAKRLESRRETRAALQRMRNLIEGQQAGIVVEDSGGKIEFVNANFSPLFGIANIRSLDEVDPTAARRRADSKPVVNELLERSDGRSLERDYTPLYVSGRLDRHLWIYRNVSDRKRDEQLIEYQKLQMSEAQRLSSLGEMAGGLAHEINNPMSVIYGRASHLHELSCEGEVSKEVVRRYSGEIVEVSDRVIKIVKGLRAFARVGDQDPMESMSVATIVADTLSFCRQKFKMSGVELREHTVDPTLKVNCRAVQISQILLNLLNNSFDAIEELPEKWIEVDAYAVSGEVLITVTDCGRGLTKETQEKIFSPFFTTKKSTKGTGLGLSISQRIAHDHSGDLQVDSTCRNTRFVLRLPQP